MKAITVYETRDKKRFNSISKAETHSLDMAVKKLNEVLKLNSKLVNTYGLASDIVASCIVPEAEEVNENYYNLFDALAFIKDAMHVKETD